MHLQSLGILQASSQSFGTMIYFDFDPFFFEKRKERKLKISDEAKIFHQVYTRKNTIRYVAEITFSNFHAFANIVTTLNYVNKQ